MVNVVVLRVIGNELMECAQDRISRKEFSGELA